MGVHGLTTFLKESRHSLSRTLELKSENGRVGASAHSPGRINLVVDGWSLIYAVVCGSGEPWVYGGENAALGGYVETLVSAWTSVGVKPTFVFDGPAPPLKYPTVISRLQDQTVKPTNLFFRTSPAARSTPRFLAEARLAPPLAYQVVVSTLLSMEPRVRVEFANGEADPYIVALAGRLGAYAAGRDSDFLILNCEGYKGYIPFEDMVWTVSVKEQSINSPDSSIVDKGDESEFQTVTKRKQNEIFRGRAEVRNGILPPSLPVNSDIILLLRVYEPNVFAEHVSLPPPLLPLLGALVGNDYASFDFFRSTESASRGVKRVADTLASVLKEAQSGNARKIRKIDRGGQGSVMDVIGTTIERLLLWRNPMNPPASGEIDQIIEKVVQSTLQYALDDSVLLEHEGADTKDHQSMNLPGCDVGNSMEQVNQLYLRAYRRGTLHPQIMGVFTKGSCFPRLFLEDPDRECCARSIGQPIRRIIWSILNDGGGIPERTQPVDKADDHSDSWISDEDDDELVNVVEELSENEAPVTHDEYDPLAALRGKLQRLSSTEETTEKPEATDLPRPLSESRTSDSYVDVIRLPQSKIVTEYIRRGARIVGEDLETDELHHFLPDYSHSVVPIQLRSMDERLRAFLQALGSDTHSIREIATEEARNAGNSGRLLSVLSLRWVLRALHIRAKSVEDGSRIRERNKEKWTRSEAQAFLACLYDKEEVEEYPNVDVRAVQLTAQILAAYEACGWLAQALLLVDLPGARKNVEEDRLPILVGSAEKSFTGRRFHCALRHLTPVTDESFFRLWHAVEEGLEDAFGEEKQKRDKKERRRNTKVPHRSMAPASRYEVLSGFHIQ